MPARATDIRPLITDRILIDQDRVWQLMGNPNIRSVERVEPLADGRALVHVTRVAPERVVRHSRRPAFRVEGGGRYLLVMTLLLGIPAVLVGTGWLIFVLLGDQIADAYRAAAPVAIGILSVLFVAWWASRKPRCPGLHCGGCSHH